MRILNIKFEISPQQITIYFSDACFYSYRANSLRHRILRLLSLKNFSIIIESFVFFHRVDKKGMICDQLGVFRVNCVDCLDRTNVVQSAVARLILETQVRTVQ